MLSAEQLQLITAAVDGELSATEARAFRLLLSTSAEAREVYAKLKADSDRVRTLPRATPPADLTAKVMARIASATPAPVRKPAKTPSKSAKPLAEPAKPVHAKEMEEPARRELPGWVPAAIAAGLLLCVTAGSFAYFASGSPPANPNTAKNPWSNALPAPQDAPTSVPSSSVPAAQELTRPESDAVVRSGVPVPPLPLPKEVIRDAITQAPEPRSVERPLVGSGILPPLKPLDRILVQVPFLRSISDLDREDIRQELTDELGSELAFRLDLFVRDTARGADVFQNAAKAYGLTVFADAATLEKLKKKQVASVVVYTENLTAAELSALFAKVATEDAKFSPRVCDSLHATAVARSDEYELKQILGLDVGIYKRPGGNGSPGQGVKPSDKPLSAGTIESVTKTLTTPPKASEKFAVLMTWQATAGASRTPPAMSNELKQFLAKRTDRKPNAVPAIIVIRPAG